MEQWRAAAWMVGAILSFTSMAIAGRAIAGELDTFEIMLYRSSLGLILVIGVSYYIGTLPQINLDQFRLHLVRNIFHFTGQNLWFFALPLIPLAQLFAFEFTSPIWVMLLAPLFLSEVFNMRKIGVAALGFVGVLIVARPEFDAINVGVIAAAAAAIGFAGAAITTRKLTQTDTLTSILFFLTLIQLVFGLICAGYDGNVALPSWRITPWVVLIGGAGLTAHFCMTKSLSLAPASVVMPVDFARLPLIAVIGMVFYGELLDVWVVVGAALILAANYVNLRAKS